MMGNMGGMMKKVQEMQAKMQEMQKELENKTVEAESGGGMVKVTMNGKQVVQSINIDPSLLSEDEKEVLEDLIKAALNQAKEKVEEKEVSLDETSKQIVSILDEYIKPAVASDGGNILFESYDSNRKIVKVILQGACSGCPSSTITLKNGIENMLKEMLSDKVDSVVAING